MRRAERFETVVIGGGQAGLAVGHHLARRGRDFVIIDAAARVGDAWRTRWEGLRLFTAARLDGLPGMPFPGDPAALPTKDEVADYLEAYADRMRLPIRSGVEVTELAMAHDGRGFSITAGAGRYEAGQVVVATGAYHRPRVPGFAAELDPAIVQVHSKGFRRPSQLRDGPVLVVGASNSGAEIAVMAARDHRTVLVGRDTGTMPIRPEDRLAPLFDAFFLFFLDHIATVDTPIGRAMRPSIRDHGLPLERIRPGDLAAAGVERVHARAVGVRDGQPLLDDGRVVEVSNVVWATGFRPDFGWIGLPAIGPDGWPMQARGVVGGVPGLYFIGLPFMYTATSSLLAGVGRDAAYLVDRMAAATRPVLASGRQRPAASP